MAGVLTYQLAAIRFGWTRISHLWPANVVVFAALMAHFIEQHAHR